MGKTLAQKIIEKYGKDAAQPVGEYVKSMTNLGVSENELIDYIKEWNK